MKKRFTIAIEETCVEEFEITAESKGEAMEIAEKRYRNGDIILESGEVQFRQMAIVAPSEGFTEWVELLGEFEELNFTLKELIIKEQHNCRATGYWKTNSVKYNFLLIAHEYLFVFRK